MCARVRACARLGAGRRVLTREGRAAGKPLLLRPLRLPWHSDSSQDGMKGREQGHFCLIAGAELPGGPRFRGSDPG